MKYLKNNLKIFWILFCIGFILLGVTYVYAWHGVISYSMFWISIVIICLSLLTIIIGSDQNYKVIIALFLLGISIYSIHIYRSPTFFVNRDEMMHYQGYKLIIKNNSLNIEHTTFPIIKEYPGLELNITFINKLTNLNAAIAGKILIGLAHSMLLVFLWLLFDSFGFLQKIASLGAYVYAFCPRYVLFDCMVSYESLGIMLFVLIIYLINKKLNYYKISYSILIILSIISIVVTHHLSSIMLGLLIFVMLLVDRIINKQNNSIFSVFCLTWIFIFGWIIYNTTKTFPYLLINLKTRLLSIFQLSFFGGEGARKLMSGSPIPIIEQILVKYCYPSILLVTLAISFIFVIKYSKIKGNMFIVLLIFGPLFFLSTWPLVLVGMGHELAYRLWPYFWVGVSYYIAITYYLLWYTKNFNKCIITVCIILLTISGIALARNEVDRFPIQKNYYSNATFYTIDLFNAQKFLNNNTEKVLKIAGTMSTRDVFGCYGGNYVKTKIGKKILISNNLNKNFFKNLYKVDWVVIDERISCIKYSHPLGYFESRTEKGDWFYGYRSTVPKYNLTKFNYVEQATINYNNGDIKLLNVLNKNDEYEKV